MKKYINLHYLIIFFLFASLLLFINCGEGIIILFNEDGFATRDKAYYKDITIDSSMVIGSGSHTDFPVLISLVDSDLHDRSEVDGSDIAFYSGATPLDFEIESFDLNYTGSEARLVAWVSIPSLSTSTDTTIRMYYYLYPGVYENAGGVWDADYKLVWHLNDDAGSNAQDSTSYNFSGNLVGSPAIVEGKIGKSLNLDGVDDLVSSSFDASNLGILGNTARTFSLWTRFDGSTSDNSLIFAVGFPAGGALYQGFSMVESLNNRVSLWVGGEWFQNCSFEIRPDGSPNNVWVHYTVVYDGNVNVKGYVNGALAMDGTLDSPLVTTDHHGFGIGQSYFAKGDFDEMRVSTGTHSADWIATEYNNQSNPGIFYSISAEMIGFP